MSEFPISSMPEELLRHATQRTGWYSTILTKMRHPGTPHEESAQAGCGTFVRTGTIYGVLTANHVAQLFENGWHLGLVLRPETHTFAVRPQYFDIVHIATGPIECVSPDLSFLRIHAPFVGTIQAYKSFYNLDAFETMMLNNPPQISTGAWFLFGAPGIHTTQEEPEGGLEEVFGYHSFCGAVGVDEDDPEEEYDFLSAVVEYTSATTTPVDFHGVSGGGLWHALLRYDSKGGIDDHEYLLSGVAVCQSSVLGAMRTIRCHGRESIYRYAIRRIRDQCA
jgi:hypothetical protein